MAVTTTSILAPGNTATSSTAVTVDAGSTVTIGIYAASAASLPPGAIMSAKVSTPGVSNRVFEFSDTVREQQFVGPCVITGDRNAYSGTAFGFYKSV